MEEKREKSGAGVATIAAIGILVGLLVLYGLSSGPATWLHARGWISTSTIQSVYYPLGWACNKCQPLQDVVTWWDALFYPPDP